jgi:hypothetical protein
MRLSSLALLHLAGVSAGVLLAIKAAAWPGRSKWIVVVGAAVCAALNAGAVVAALV